jgi:UDP-N-acetylmuramoylalanine--D-glutamate ligase
MSDGAPSAVPLPSMQGRRVLVLGLGDTGLAMARWCARLGATVRAWDSRGEAAPQAAALREAVPGVELAAGVLDAEALEGALEGVQRVLKSPGLAPHDPGIAPLLAAARAAGVPVGGELDLFTEALAALHPGGEGAPKLIAITGTNGKTTTTALTGGLLERAGLRTAVAGNIGPPMLQALAAALDAHAAEGTPMPAAWVLELSSFQLHDSAAPFEPDAAVVLNVTQDHLDWHGSFEAYAAAKAKVYGRRRAVMVVNRDDTVVEAMARPEAVPVGPRGGRAGKAPPPREVQRFGLGTPAAPGDFGLVTENGMAWLVRALPDEDAPRRRGAPAAAAEAFELHLQRLMPADALRIRGRHNAANALAALALATAAGAPLAPMLHGLREYRGEPHRVAPVGRVGGVEAFDDSKGTNVGATVAAITGLGADLAPAKLVLILGGEGKGQDFAPLLTPVAAHARAAMLIGRDAPRIAEAFAGTGVAIEHHATIEAAVEAGFAAARPGDALLLSPACASLDMFRNYVHRAECFVAAVRAAAAARGQDLEGAAA